MQSNKWLKLAIYLLVIAGAFAIAYFVLWLVAAVASTVFAIVATLLVLAGVALVIAVPIFFFYNGKKGGK